MSEDRDLTRALERLAEHGRPVGAQTVLDRAELEFRSRHALAMLEQPRRPNRRWTLAIAAAAVTALLIASPLILLGSGRNEAPVATQPDVRNEAPDVTQPGVTMTWHRIPDQPAFEEAFVAGVVSGGPGLVAVGYVLEAPPPADFASDGAVWVSTDGLAWQRVTDPALPTEPGGRQHLYDVAAGPLGLLALGSDGMYTSTDGITWSRVEDDDLFGIEGTVATDIASVEAGGPGWVAVGGDRGDAAVWVSVDGLQWDRVEDESFASPKPGSAWLSMEAVIAGGPGLVAIGGETSGEAVELVMWLSLNGLEWERLPDDTFDGDPGWLSIVADPASERLIAFGRDAIYSSSDGRQWEQMVDLATGTAGESLRLGSWDGDRIVAWGDRSSRGNALPWVSRDQGMTWHRLDTARPAFDDIGWYWVWDSVLFKDRVVAVGGSVGLGNDAMQRMAPGIGTGSHGAVWIGQWDQ